MDLPVDILQKIVGFLAATPSALVPLSMVNRALSGLTQDVEVRLSLRPLTGPQWAGLSNIYPKVVEVQLLNHPGLPVPAVGFLQSQAQNLRRLRIGPQCIPADPAAFEALLPQLTRLEELFLESCQPADQILEIVSGLTQLNRLALRNCPHLDEVSESISSLILLQDLDLSENPSLVGLPGSMTTLTGLRSLNMSGYDLISSLQL